MAICTLNFRSLGLNSHKTMSILLPDQGRAGERYPVVYQLGGEGDDHTTWLRNTSIEALVRELPLVVVFPDGGYGRYTDWCEFGPAYERYIIEDVVNTVERYFPVSTKGEGRAIGGVSMGGYGAMKLALKYPQMFCSVATHSGSYLTAHEYMEYMEEERIQYWIHHIYGPDSRGGKDDIFALAEQVDHDCLPRIRFDCGVEDVLLPASRKLHAHFGALEIMHSYFEYPGGHEWGYWAAHIHEAIEFHAANLLDLQSNSEAIDKQ
jgi:putative tributyrin esterase